VRVTLLLTLPGPPLAGSSVKEEKILFIENPTVFAVFSSSVCNVDKCLRWVDGGIGIGISALLFCADN